MNYRLMAWFLGLVFAGTGVLMAFSLLWSVWFWEPHAIVGLLAAMVVSILLGLLLVAAGRTASSQVYQREALGLVGLSWLAAGLVGGLPYWFSGELTLVESIFESTSGFTTTGASILTDIEALPKGLLFWRSFTHWLGGMGIILMFIAILPYLGAGGKQLFRSESPGPDPRGLKPRIRESAAVLWSIYIILTFVQTILMMVGGLDFYDALCHTFGTLATGGFSTYGDSIAHFNSLYIELVIIVFMVIAGTNFGLFFEMRRGNYRALFQDSEWRMYIGLLAGAIVLVTLNLSGWIGAPTQIKAGPDMSPVTEEALRYNLPQALRAASFQVVSIMTTTGYATDDFNEWPELSRMTLVVLMFLGGCAGSTSGGLKVVRILLMLKIAYWRLEKTFRPKTIRAVRLNGAVVDEETQRTLASFMVIYGVWLLIGVMLLSALGLPFETTITAVVACINVIGPGLEFVGATGNYALIPDIGKVYLTLCMILGRLELFAVTVLFVPAFWRVGR